MRESHEQFLEKKVTETAKNKEQLTKAGGMAFEQETNPETGEEKCYVNFFGRRLETAINDEAEFERIKESVSFSELDEKMFIRIAEAYTLRHSLMLEGDPGAGKTFAYSKFNEFLNGENERPLILTCTPKMSELEIIGHWMPTPGGRESASSAVKAAYERYDAAKQKYDATKSAYEAKPNDEGTVRSFEQAQTIFRDESNILHAETEGQVEWTFKKGALLESYSGNGGRGRMLVVDEFNLLPSNVQQIFLKSVSQGGRIADSIEEMSNSRKDVYERGKNTYICYAQNFPEKTRGRNVVAAPMTDRVEWFTIQRELVEAKEGSFIESWGGAVDLGGKRGGAEIIERVNFGKRLPELLDGNIVRIFGGIAKKFHQEYKQITASSPDKFGEDERTQELETSSRRFIHAANHMEHFMFRGEDGKVDLQKTLKDAITKNYIDRIYDADLRGNLFGLLDHLLVGQTLGIIEFESKTITAAAALDILKERLSQEEYERAAGPESPEEAEARRQREEAEEAWAKIDAFEEDLAAKISALEEDFGVEGLSLSDAERLLGKESVLGPKDVEKVFGIKLDRIPPIPFSREEINRAKELGQQLILQVDTFSKEGMTHPINPATLCNAFTSAHDTKPLWYNNKWYTTDPVISIESPRTGWRLTSKDLIPNSTENYLQQTDVLIEYLQKQVFKGAKLPKPYKDAIAEWKRKRAEIEPLATSETETEWNRGSQMLADLAITKLTRELLVEVMYRFILNDQINKDKPLPSAYTWTASRTSDGRLVHVGRFDGTGAAVDRSRPDYRDDSLGVSFSRS